MRGVFQKDVTNLVTFPLKIINLVKALGETKPITRRSLNETTIAHQSAKNHLPLFGRKRNLTSSQHRSKVSSSVSFVSMGCHS